MAARTISHSCVQSTTHTSPTVRAFLQLASRRALPVMDFLAPRASQHVHPLPLRSLSGRSLRAFSKISAHQETVAIFNPRKDEDGQDMNVEITPRASNRLREIMIKDANPNLALRITVESGGCHGFQYIMSLTTLPPLSDFPPAPSSPALTLLETPPAALDTLPSGPNAMPSESPTSSISHSSGYAEEALVGEDDTVFKALDGSEAKVVMDGPSLELLKGSKIDYTMELIGSQFKVADNPLATSSCGCGTSFDIKA